MNVHAMSNGTVNSQLTQISNHRSSGLSRQGKISSQKSGRQNIVSGQNNEEAMESASEKAREATSQRKNSVSGMKSKINLYA